MRVSPSLTYSTPRTRLPSGSTRMRFACAPTRSSTFGMRERRLEAASLGVHLAAARIGKRVPWRRRALQPRFDVDAERQRERMEANALQASANGGDRRFVGDRRNADRAPNAWAPSDRRRSRRAPDRAPRRGSTTAPSPRREMASRGVAPSASSAGSEILRPIASEDRAVELRVAADVIVIAGIEGRARAVDPRLLRTIDAALEDRARVPRVGTVGQRTWPRSRMTMRAPDGASPAASVAPPMPEPMMTMSTVVRARHVPRHQSRHVAFG